VKNTATGSGDKKKAEKAPVEDEEEEKVTPKTSAGGAKKTKNLDAETVNKAVEITSEQINKKLLASIPKTAAGFEADFMSLKKDMPTFYSYLRNIHTETVQSLFKTAEISSELFSAILKVTNDYGITGDDEAVNHSARLMAALSKASSIDMTLMFMDSKEKKDLVNIVKTLKKNSDRITAGAGSEVLK